MELDIMSGAMELHEMQGHARAVEDAGFSTMWLTESGRTAYLSAAAAGLATERLGIGTAVAVAFPRSPMITASVAWELSDATGGRFTLGLGTQIKAHIERRYSAAYAPPGPRMKEYVQSLQAIFRAFRGDEKLDFDGEYYSFSLLPAQWSPGPIGAPDPKIFVSAVLPWMSRMAGEVCDGIHIHPFNSAAYVSDVQRPHVEEGVSRGGRNLSDVIFEIPVMTPVGDTDEELAETREHARQMIAFYGSTRTYSPVFETHGYDGLSDQLHAKQREGDLAGMVSLITDDVLDHYTVSGSWSTLGANLVDRYKEVAPSTRLMTYTASGQLRKHPDILDRWAQVARDVAAA
ncbi:MAG: TIGR03617 family F420-dependent LLM class oxidoreductase [Acidimicrobiales bacterium]|jgi:probable F420-dependent oxidoreductase|nr:TIGR03617 family F420-dependent LLM class oxidoreductase [Acidimicrobiales bacterium]